MDRREVWNSQYNEELIIENWDSIKTIIEYSKVSILKWEKNNGYITIVGNLTKSISKTKDIKIKIYKETFLKFLENSNREVFLKSINNVMKNERVVEESIEFKNIHNTPCFLQCTFINEYGYVKGIIRDITGEINLEEEYKNIIEYDAITGLPTKYYVKDKIDDILNECEENKIRSSMLLIDLDNFKFINDSFGHEEGDLLLSAVSQALLNVLEDDDLICRYSGDEFIIFRPKVENTEEIENLAGDIINLFNKPLRIRYKELYITASIGISISPDNGTKFETLLKNSDAAMYRAKSNGKSNFVFFDKSISLELSRVYDIQRYLRTAIENNEMYVVFQPKVMLKNKKVNGLEALLRWNSKELGVVSPNEIIPIAEMTRLILPIGSFVLEEVFKKCKELIDNGNDDFKIAVNLSELQLRYNTVIDDFKRFSKKYNVSARYIEIEITESILMKSFDKNIKILEEIRELGASIALDDFGTGYSSLNYLTKLPIDVLKIDRSFVTDILNDFRSRCIVENIIKLSHQLGIEVVAEGVEVGEQVIYLKSILCDIVQGYYYSKPDKFEAISNLIGEIIEK